MCRQRNYAIMMGILAVSGLALSGCRNTYPHSFAWPAPGDVGRTHGEPPEGAYHGNWDPYSVEIELTPAENVSPVQTQHLLVATVKDKDGKTLPNRRVEWLIAKGSIGDIVEVDESGWRNSRGHKVTNDFAITHTNNGKHTLTRGNDDPDDDVHLTAGQTWAVITSPVEGDTHVVAYVPGVYNWDKHKAFAVQHWYDVRWEFPPDATNPIGTTHEMVTKVVKYSDGSPLPGYMVTYSVTAGPDAVFEPGGQSTVSVETDAQGLARVVLKQSRPVEGVNDINIDVMRPENAACCKPAVHIATGQASKTWVGPEIAIRKTAPAREILGAQFQYAIAVSNPSQVDATDVVVTDTLPDGIVYVSASPGAQVSGQTLSWSMGTLQAGGERGITVQVKSTRVGQFENCAAVRAAGDLSARDCATTVITAPKLTIEKVAPAEVLLCDPIEYKIVVRNTGDAPATNVKIVDTLPAGLTDDKGRSQVVFDAGTLEPGKAKQASFTAKASQTGEYVNKVAVTADGGLAAEATTTTVVRQPVLEVTKTGPAVRYVGRPVAYEITVTNKGNAAARDTVLIDTLPAGVEFISASDNGRMDDGKVTWSLGVLQPGASKKVSLNVKGMQAGTLRNTANVTALCAEGSAAVTTELKGIPAVLLEVIDLEDPIEVGTTVTYQIIVTNQGSAPGTNIVIACVLPAQEDYVSSTGPTQAAVTDKTVKFAPLPVLAPKAKATYRIVVRATGAGDVRFSAALTSDQTTVPVEETESTYLYE